MRGFIKSLIEQVPSSFFERLLALSLINEKFSAIRSKPKFKVREDLSRNVSDKFNDEKITVLEFEVYQGYSIKKFAGFNTN